MKPYRVTVEVTTTYTVEVHAEDGEEAMDIAWCLDEREIAIQGSENEWEITSVVDAEEIQRESEEDE